MSSVNNRQEYDSVEDQDYMRTLDRSDDRLELSSFFDTSDVMEGGDYEMLHPRKADSKAIQSFKLSMLETVIKPMSWKDHSKRIE